MTQVFLSHSSKQKGYVDVIANKLGKFNIVYDVWTFENGNKILDEIYSGIDSSGLFVYFISNEALDSSWVEKEINRAEKYLKDGRLKRFLPFLIDKTINHGDPRIPEWIKEEYNLKYISKPTKCFDLIKQALRLYSWELYPKKRLADQLFIGRTAEIKLFEERIYDFDRPNPVGIIVSGLYSIGRRKFLKHVLVNANKIKPHYFPPVIALDGRNSIEDLIVKLYGLGYSHLPSDVLKNLSTRTIIKKIQLAAELISELYENNDIVYVLDSLAIVNKQGRLADWYLPLIEVIRPLNGLAICVISQARTRTSDLLHNDYVFSIDIPELESYERKAFFRSLLELEKIELSNENFKLISNQFTGFPEQIIYTILLLKHEGLNYVIDNPHEIIEYSTEKVTRLVKAYESDQLALQILKILSEAEFLSFNVLEDILQDDFQKAKDIIFQFSNEFIIEYIGNIKEFIRLNDSVKDYIQRLGYKMEEKYRTNLQRHTQLAFKDYEVVDRDISDYVLSFKEALKNNYEVPQEFLIPSHYVNAMRELYNYERRFGDVITLAERILQNEKYLDSRINREIRYWMCLSLARKKDKRILKEVQKIDGPDHDFLVGFYYRLIGRNDDAISRFISVLDDTPNFHRAKRELVQAFLNTEQYQEAFDLARENYYQDKNNPYNLQSYFRCLIKTDGIKAKKELQELLDALEVNPHEKAFEMFLTAKAMFQSIILHDEPKAMQIVEDAIASFPGNIYPYLTKLELLRWKSDFLEIEKTINEIEKEFHAESGIFNKLPYLSNKCIFLAKSGQKEQAMQILNKEIRSNFSKHIYEKLLEELDS